MEEAQDGLEDGVRSQRQRLLMAPRESSAQRGVCSINSLERGSARGFIRPEVISLRQHHKPRKNKLHFHFFLPGGEGRLWSRTTLLQ